MHGKGRKQCHNGEVYEGDFWNGQYHGFGIAEYKDGRKYVGLWEHGLKHDEGAHKDSNG